MEKTKMKLWKKILIAIGILLVLFAIVTWRNIIILTKLDKLGEKTTNEATNYYAEKYNFNDKQLVFSKTYYKDSKYVSITKAVNEGEETKKITRYYDGSEGITITEDGENRIINDNVAPLINIMLSATPLNLNISNTDFLYKIKLYITSKLTSEKFNEKECYVLEADNGNKLWIDKENGLVVRRMSKDTIEDIYYEFNVVTDDEIIKPS